MSADLMMVCVKRDEYFDGLNSKDCVCVDEMSMGEPWTEFGKIMQAHEYSEIDDALIERVKHWHSVLTQNCELDKVLKWLEDHKGEHLSFEGW